MGATMSKPFVWVINVEVTGALVRYGVIPTAAEVVSALEEYWEVYPGNVTAEIVAAPGNRRITRKQERG
jgi:hypothetical protein